MNASSARSHAGFPRTNRLTRASEYEQALRRPDFRLSDGVLRLAVVHNSVQTPRLGLIVGKKAVAKAHDRNRTKRIIRNRFRTARCTLGSLDIVVRVTAPTTAKALHLSLDVLFDALENRSREPDPVA